MNNKVVIFCYHSVDDNMMEASLRSLRRHSDCSIYVHHDGLSKEFVSLFGKDVFWVKHPSWHLKDRRALWKVETYCTEGMGLPDTGVRVIVADVDTIFIKDPFEAFGDFEFDLGLTGRSYDYHFPINAGMIYFKTSMKMRHFLAYHRIVCSSYSWPFYADWRKKWNHERFGSDWTVGQDFLNCCCLKRRQIESEFGIQIGILSDNYNYCPARDRFGESGSKELVRGAFRDRLVSVLHLKSSLKELLYDGSLGAYGINKPKPKSFNWRELGKETFDASRT